VIDVVAIRTDLERLVGADYVKECPEELKRKLDLHEADIWYVEPGSEAEVAAVLGYAEQHDLAVIPSGNGASLHVGAAPRRANIVVSSKRLSGIVEHSIGDLTITVQAGTPYAEMQAYLREHGQFVPLTAPSQDSTVGGLAVTAFGGPERILYGSWRDFVIGLRVVYPNGQVVRSGGKVVKNVAGYDMTKLFVGSYGTLAFVTEITLKVRPYPKHRELVAIESRNRNSLIQLAERVLASELVPSTLELTYQAAGGSASYQLWIGSDEVEAAARYQENRIREFATAIGGDMQIRVLAGEAAEKSWPGTMINLDQTASDSIVLRAGFPISRMTDLLAAFERMAAERNILLQYSVSLGVGTLRLLLQSDNSAILSETTVDMRRLAEENDGYLVLEYGESALKQQVGVWGNASGGLSLMKGIKQTVDPAGIMSPGRYAGGI
jgi:glycolate oxidase FAD binding subunit